MILIVLIQCFTLYPEKKLLFAFFSSPKEYLMTHQNILFFLIMLSVIILLFCFLKITNISKKHHFKCKNCTASFKVSPYVLLITPHFFLGTISNALFAKNEVGCIPKKTVIISHKTILSWIPICHMNFKITCFIYASFSAFR